jgi:hypothetical protein
MAEGTSKAREVLILIAGAALGAILVSLVSRGASKVPHEVRSLAALPVVEVNLAGSKKPLGSFVYAGSPRDQADAWLGYLTEPKKTLLRWKDAGDYPVFDVPPGWAAVWLDAEGKVLGSSDGNGARTNMVLPGQGVRQALILPKAEVPAAGTVIQVFERQALGANGQ